MALSVSRRDRISSIIRRTGWLVVAGVHLPGLVHAWRAFLASGFASEHILGCLWLTLTVAFLVLKVQDAAFLRFRTDLRSFLAIVTVVALLHVDLMPPVSEPTLVSECVAVLVTACVIVAAPQVRRWWETVAQGARVTLKHLNPQAASAATVWLSAFRPHCWVLALRLFHLRAPPA